MRGRKTKATPANKKKFVSQLRKHGKLVKAAASIGVTRRTIWNWRTSDEDFNDAILKAIEGFTYDYRSHANEMASGK